MKYLKWLSPWACEKKAVRDTDLGYQRDVFGHQSVRGSHCQISESWRRPLRGRKKLLPLEPKRLPLYKPWFPHLEDVSFIRSLWWCKGNHSLWTCILRRKMFLMDLKLEQKKKSSLWSRNLVKKCWLPRQLFHLRHLLLRRRMVSQDLRWRAEARGLGRWCIKVDHPAGGEGAWLLSRCWVIWWKTSFSNAAV